MYLKIEMVYEGFCLLEEIGQVFNCSQLTFPEHKIVGNRFQGKDGSELLIYRVRGSG